MINARFKQIQALWDLPWLPPRRFPKNPNSLQHGVQTAFDVVCFVADGKDEGDKGSSHALYTHFKSLQPRIQGKKSEK